MGVKSNKILEREYYILKTELLSPICVSSGESRLTDSDLMVNYDGEVFIPGTSIAGALRNYLCGQDQKAFTGYSESNNGRMSSLCVSDLYFDSDNNKSIRDGVKLTDGKTVDNKFDLEVLETGATGYMYLNYVVRENDNKEQFEKCIEQLIKGIDSGEIRFGANKNRGYGRIKVNSVYNKCFTSKDVKEYIDYDPKMIPEKGFIPLEKWMEEHAYIRKTDYIKISVPLKQNGGISIRKYSAKPNEADYEQITLAKKDENGQNIPTIPGTSWNGAIRADCVRLLKEMGDKDAHKHVENWFGYVKVKDKQSGMGKSLQSMIVIGESQIKNSKMLRMTRNQINRFDASTIDGALYTEKACFNGRTELQFMVRKDEKYDYKAAIGLLLLVIKDIKNGYVAIGGQTAVGRGLFETDFFKNEQGVEKEKNTKISEGSQEEYNKALYVFLMKGEKSGTSTT